jgi:hypothetical protein
MQESGYDVRNISDGCTYFVLVWRNILSASLLRDKHCFVWRCILSICNFLNSVTFLCALCVNYSPPQIMNTCVPN